MKPGHVAQGLVSRPPQYSRSFLHAFGFLHIALFIFLSNSPSNLFSRLLTVLSHSPFYFFSFLASLPFKIYRWVYFLCVLWKFSNIRQSWKNFTINTCLSATWTLDFTVFASWPISLSIALCLFHVFQWFLDTSVLHLNTWAHTLVIRGQHSLIVFVSLAIKLIVKHTNFSVRLLSSVTRPHLCTRDPRHATECPFTVSTRLPPLRQPWFRLFRHHGFIFLSVLERYIYKRNHSMYSFFLRLLSPSTRALRLIHIVAFICNSFLFVAE